MNFPRLLSTLIFGGWLAFAASARGGETVLVNEENPESLPVLTQIEKPFVFIYGQWAGKVSVQDGVAKFSTDNGKGTAGNNENMSADAEQRAVLRITVNRANKAKLLRLALRDASGNSAIWEYDLTTVALETPTFLRPIGNLPLSEPLPHLIEKVKGEPGSVPDAKKLTQWKISGDGSDDALDVDISVILLANE